MKHNIVEFMIKNKYLKKNAMMNATVEAFGLGAQKVKVAVDLLYDTSKINNHDIVIKGCDPDNLREYLVTPETIHEINGMNENTIERLFPEIYQ